MNTRISLKRAFSVLFAMVLVFSITFTGSTVDSVHAGSTPALFGEAGDLAPADYQANEHASRSRFVSVNFDTLFNESGDMYDTQQLSRVKFNLFSDTSYVGKVKHAKQDRWAKYWWGSLAGKPNGYFYMVVADDVFIAHIASPEGVYEVKFMGNGLYEVQQLDPDSFTDHPEGVVISEEGFYSDEMEFSDLVVTEGDLSAAADNGSTIDIMVAFTTNARNTNGGLNGIKALIALAVLETNVGYANSGVNPRLRLVHIEEYSYTESGSLDTDLSRLVNSSDAYFTTIHSLRNTYAADMVGLIVANGDGCGLANDILATASTAFQVTRDDCATGNYTFGHEFGHLQGARHDVYVDWLPLPYIYGHGYVYLGGSAPSSWRTVMAYTNKCTDTYGSGCVRLQYWSNNTKTYAGKPMGNSTAKNYIVLNKTAYAVANFRTTIIGSNFNSSFNGSSSGWSPVTGSWGVLNNAYYYSNGVANAFASARHTGNYGDLTYEAQVFRNGTCTYCSNFITLRGTVSPVGVANRWNKVYQFGYTNNGAFSVWEINGATETALKPWTNSSAIAQNGWNTLKVIAVGNILKFYINNTLVASVNDTTFKVGQVGVGFYRLSAAGTFYVNYAKLNTTPTADPSLMDEIPVSGEELEGGTPFQSP